MARVSGIRPERSVLVACASRRSTDVRPELYQGVAGTVATTPGARLDWWFAMTPPEGQHLSKRVR